MLTSTRAPRESPSRRTRGAPPGLDSTSTRRRGKQIPVPSKHLITASLAAQRPASFSAEPLQYASSARVKLLSRKRGPERRSASAIRSTPTASIPTLRTAKAYGPSPPSPTGEGPLLDGDAFRQVAGLVHVLLQVHGDVVGEQLQHDSVEKGARGLVHPRHLEDVGGDAVQGPVPLADQGQDGRLSGHAFMHVGDDLVPGWVFGAYGDH